MLLTHSSGLRDNWSILLPDYVHGDSPISLGFYMEDYFSAGGSRYDADKNFQTWEPGAKYSYCNMAVSLAAYLVEAASGTSFETWCQDNIFVERLWRTIRHNYLCLHSFGCGSEVRQGLEKWIRFYNHERGHSSLDDRTPDEVYYSLPHPFAAAA